MQVSFGVVIGIVTVLLPTMLLGMLLPVLITFSGSTHQTLLQLSSREIARGVTQAVAGKLNAGYHEARSAGRISKRIGLTPYDTSSPPAIHSQSYSAARITALGLDNMRYRRSLWLEKETRVMEQYHSAMTYLSSFTLPLPRELNAKQYDSQITTCRFGPDGSLAMYRWLLRRGKLQAHTQLLRTEESSKASSSEFPLNLTGSGFWSEQLKVPASRDEILSFLAAGALVGPTTLIPPNGTMWVAQKMLAAALEPAVVEAVGAASRIPLITEQQLLLIDRQYSISGVVSLLNRTAVAALSPMDFRLGKVEFRAIIRVSVATLLDTAVSTFFQIAGYAADYYAPFDLLANEATPASSLEEALVRDVQARNNSKKRGQTEPIFYFIDGRGNPIHSTEGVLFTEFRSNLSSALLPHPAESLPGCFGIPWPKYDGSPGMERRVSCPKNVTDDNEFVLLNQLRKSSEVNVTDFRAAMLAANRSSALLRSSLGAAADLSSEYRTTLVIDPRDGTQYEVNIAPLVTEDPNLWHYSLVVFTPENYRRGNIKTRRNVSIGIAFAIGTVALLATFFATLVISRYVTDIIEQMADPIGVENKERRERREEPKEKNDGDEPSSSSSSSCSSSCGCCSAVLQWIELDELHEVETAYRECRSGVDQLRAFVHREALALLRGGVAAEMSTPTTTSTSSNIFRRFSRNSNVVSSSDGGGGASLNTSSDNVQQQQRHRAGKGEKKKSVRFAATPPEIGGADSSAVPSTNVLPVTPATPGVSPVVSVAAAAAANDLLPDTPSCSDTDEEESANNENDNDATTTTGTASSSSYRKLPARRVVDPNAPRLFSCVVVNFPIVQRVTASNNILRDITAAAAELCNSLLSRLPVMAIEQFWGDGLICAVHIRNAARPSRTLSTVVEQLIRECGVFEKKVDGVFEKKADTIMSGDAKKLTQRGSGAVVWEEDVVHANNNNNNNNNNRSAKGGAAVSTITSSSSYSVSSEHLRVVVVHDDKNLPLVAVGIFCGPLRMSKQELSSADSSHNNSSNDAVARAAAAAAAGGGGGGASSSSTLESSPLASSFPSFSSCSCSCSSHTMRATHFIGPLVAQAEKLCRERSAVAPTRMHMSARDEEAEQLPFSLSNAERQFLVSTDKKKRQPLLDEASSSLRTTKAVWRGKRYPLLGLSEHQKRTMHQATGVTRSGGDPPADDDDSRAFSMNAAVSRETRSRVAHYSPVLLAWQQLRYAIFIPRCFVGLCMRPVSLAFDRTASSPTAPPSSSPLLHSSAEGAAAATATSSSPSSPPPFVPARTIALQPGEMQQFILLGAAPNDTTQSHALFALSRIAVDEKTAIAQRFNNNNNSTQPDE